MVLGLLVVFVLMHAERLTEPVIIYRIRLVRVEILDEHHRQHAANERHAGDVEPVDGESRLVNQRHDVEGHVAEVHEPRPDGERDHERKLELRVLIQHRDEGHEKVTEDDDHPDLPPRPDFTFHVVIGFLGNVRVVDEEVLGEMDVGVEQCHNFMEAAKDILDSAVYGLNDAKMQIMQMLGQWIANPSAMGTAIAINGPMGTGKCHALDTPILMYDGSIKMVQDIVVGDKVMGDDSSCRNVTSLGRGEDDMYDIVHSNGEKYGVNSQHIMCLKQSGMLR